MNKVTLLGAAAALAVGLSACSSPASTPQAAPATHQPTSTPSTPAATPPSPSSLGTASDQQYFDVSTSRGAGRLLAAKQVALGSEVPWRKVGDGWRLTILQQGKQHADVFRISAQMLDLVAPSGGRYQLFKTETGRRQQPWQLQDWSPDGRTALLTRGDTGRWYLAVAVDLRTGDQTSLRIPRVFGALLKPDGSGLWVTAGTARVRSIAWDGSVSTLHLGPDLMRTGDGSLIAGDRDHLTVLAPDGERASLPTPGPNCHAVRFWRPGVVLAQCFNRRGPRVAAVPLDGSPASWISMPHKKGTPDLGDFDAYRIGDTTYLQVAGACGTTFLGRQDADGSVTEINPPDSIGNVTMRGVQGDRLLVTHEMSCEPPGPPVQVLAAYDPVDRVERVLSQLPPGVQFGQILGYDSPAAVGW